MNEQEIRLGLEELTKNELIETFSSLELKPIDKKKFLIEQIIAGEPTEEEIEAFKLLLEDKSESENIVEDEDKSAEPVYIVVHPINEDGKKYKPGMEYKGGDETIDPLERAKRYRRFLQHGQIREKE